MRAPDVDHGFQEGFQELAEGEEVGYEGDCGVEEELLRCGVGERWEEVEERGRVGFEEGGEGAVFFVFGVDTDFAGGGLFDGEVVVEDVRDVF